MNKPLALVVEDNKNLSEIFSQALAEAGYMVEAMLDGQRAAAYLEAHTPHFMLLDMNLPLVSGPKLLAQIGTDARFANTRIVVATANPHMMTPEATERADCVLLKPVGFVQLFELAKRLYPSDV